MYYCGDVDVQKPNVYKYTIYTWKLDGYDGRVFRVKIIYNATSSKRNPITVYNINNDTVSIINP